MAFYAIVSSFLSSSSSSAPSPTSQKTRSRRVPDDFDSELLVVPPPNEEVERDVYLLCRPLDVPIEATYLTHWAVKVGDYVHELVNANGYCQYISQRYDGPWPREEREGSTTLHDAAVILAAIETIMSNRDYDAIANNCHRFAWRLRDRLTGQTFVGALLQVQHSSARQHNGSTRAATDTYVVASKTIHIH
ncbi:hypothetical protein B0H14DRAFT_2867325 [Mycena olivaceomarginata]|nr:hypothetical protein B0H14DRAFT_2867325 [Mycena olivaceomarginata]